MNDSRFICSESGTAQPWWYVRAQLLIVLAVLLAITAGAWVSMPSLIAIIERL